MLRDYVLGTFGKIEAAEIRALFPTLVTAIELWLHEGMAVTMNRFPGKATDGSP